MHGIGQAPLLTFLCDSSRRDDSLLGALSVPAYSAPSSLLPRAADMKYSERAEVVKAQHWTQLSGMGEKEGEEALARRSKKRAATLKGMCV